MGKACNPEFTPAIIHMLSCTNTFDCSKAQKLIGYSPVVPLEVSALCSHLTLFAWLDCFFGDAYCLIDIIPLFCYLDSEMMAMFKL